MRLHINQNIILWYLSHQRADNAQMSLYIRASQPKLCLFSYTNHRYTRGDQKVRRKVLLNRIAFIDFNENP